MYIAATERYKGTRNEFRVSLLDGITLKTNQSLSEFYNQYPLSKAKGINKIHFMPEVKPCSPNVIINIMKWMRESVFCLQPPGDTNSRKSFYDALLNGCIPVTFQIANVSHVTYPFESVLDYSKFTVKVPLDKTYMEVLEPYKTNFNALSELQRNLLQVLPYLQYNDPTSSFNMTDAFDVVMYEIARHFYITA